MGRSGAVKYAVNEAFASIQGEGCHMGKACGFIRLQGCDQACPWCDSAGTWHKNYLEKTPKKEAAEILDTLPTGLPFVVVTGGEPTLWDLHPLVEAIHARGMQAHLETAGHHPIRGRFDWITVSPKPFAAHPLPDNLHKAHEYKLIVEGPGSLAASRAAIQGGPYGVPIWLHPEWSKREDDEVKRVIIETVLREGEPYRAGWQLHKLYRADALSPTSAKRLIPLGGNPLNGY
jgi:organic radical activating enzyme